MMSTEYSASSGMASSTTASIVEVEAADTESLFKLKGRPPSLDEDQIDDDDDDSDPDNNSDKLMMTEYDEDNVIVIDLSEERNGSTKNLELTCEDDDVPDHLRPQRPRKTMFGSSDEDEAEAENTVVVMEPAKLEASLNGTPQQPGVSNAGPILVADIHIRQTSMTTTNGNVNEETQLEMECPTSSCQETNEDFQVGGAFRNELSTPPLQKTINSKEDVRSHLFEDQENLGSPQLEAAISVIPLRPESGILPPVVPYKSFSSKNLITVAEPPTAHSASTVSAAASATSPASSSCIVAEKPQSPKRRQTGAGTGERSSHRKSILQRSRTINYVPENCNSPPDHQDNLIHLSNGRSHLNSSAGFHHDQAVFWRDTPATTDTTATTTTTEDIEETRESRKKQHHYHHHHRKQQKKHRSHDKMASENTRPITDTGTLPRSSARRSTSCRRETEPPMRPMTTHNIMSMSMIGNSLGGGYGEPDGAYERRRRARSNDYLDRIDVCSSVLLSTRSATTIGPSAASKRKLTPKMSRVEHGLYLGSLEAATDVILLESNAISHIVTCDSVPLPRKITSMMPRIAMLHLQVTDLPQEDLLSHFTESNAFIQEGLAKDGAVLVHCYRGRSRSATVVVAFLMQKHGYSAERALAKVRSKREIIQPHDSFLAQLRLYENMEFSKDPENLQFKMFKLHMAAMRMRQAKILFRDTLESVIDPDPSGGLPGSAASALASASRGRYPLVYKCKKCRRTLATAFNLLPHIQDESPIWTASKWSLPAEDVLEAASENGLRLCSASVFINPVKWMEPEIRQNLSGRLYCPNCQTRVGQYSWILGKDCGGCEANVNPSFSLDITEIIFRTKNRFLQSNQREAVVV